MLCQAQDLRQGAFGNRSSSALQLAACYLATHASHSLAFLSDSANELLLVSSICPKGGYTTWSPLVYRRGMGGK